MNKLLKRAWPYLLVILIAWGLIYAARLVPKIIPVAPEKMSQASQGVVQNLDWQPVIRRVTGVDMALVPAGCFMMGSTDTQLKEADASCDSYYGAYGCRVSFDHEQPAHQVCISKPYWIDLTAVTNRQYGESSNLGKSYSPQTQPNWPRETVKWQEAADFCLRRGARLPTEAEWEYAARGPDAVIYPWGNEFDLEKATLRKISPAPVGQKPAGASWVGALDMSGGIGEWVQDWYGPYPGDNQTDPAGPENGEKRILRGGNWFAHAAFFVRTTFRDPVDPAFATMVVGFRCVKDHSP